MDPAALADFLTARRGALRPEDVGLPAGARRRTPGLRREEVAMLAAMSVDSYTRMEQRRGARPSPQLLASLARAIRLSADERDYLYRVAGHPPPDRARDRGFVAPPLLRVLDRLADTPALILTDLGETLVQNGPARALFGDVDRLTGPARSAVYRWFVTPDAERGVYPAADHGRQGRAHVASLRAAVGAAGPGSRAAALAREIEAASPEFAELWRSQVVGRRFEDHKTVLHPEIGAIDVDCQALYTEDASQVLLTLTAAPGTEAAGKLDLLAVLGSQRIAADAG